MSSSFTFAPELENDITFLLDLPFEVSEDIVEFTKVCETYLKAIKDTVSSGRSVIFMYYNEMTATFLKTLLEKPDKPNAAAWQILTFFHSDEEIRKTKLSITPEQFQNVKFNQLLSMTEYPFIKKYHIPYGFEITYDYLKGLLLHIMEEE